MKTALDLDDFFNKIEEMENARSDDAGDTEAEEAIEVISLEEIG
jgi:hypothetical protein